MNNCDNAPWASGPTDEPLKDISLTDEEFELECLMMYGFPQPQRLPNVCGMYDDIEMPCLWNEVTEFMSKDNSGDFQMAPDDIVSMVTDSPLPDRAFTMDNLKDWTTWQRFTDSETNSESDKVYCPLTNTRYDAEMKSRAFISILIRYRSADRILDVMRDIFPQAANKLDEDIKVIMNPRFRLPVEKSKEDVNKSKTKNNAYDEGQEKAKKILINRIVFSAYYNSLFKKDCTTLFDTHDLAIIRLQCPLREEDETEEVRKSSRPQKRTRD
jgi:hypothetical protein